MGDDELHQFLSGADGDGDGEINWDDPNAQLVQLDSRGRITLGKLATHKAYTAYTSPAGRIVLVPTMILPIGHPLSEILDRAVDGQTVSRGRRPQRKEEPT